MNAAPAEGAKTAREKATKPECIEPAGQSDVRGPVT